MKTRLFFQILFFSTTVFATADGPDYWKVKKIAVDDSLNIRAKPDWKSKKIGEIPYNGLCLENLACVGGLTFQESSESSESSELSDAEKLVILKKHPRWCKIKFNKKTGWVAAIYLTEGQQAECYQ